MPINLKISNLASQEDVITEKPLDRLLWYELSSVFSLTIMPTLACNLRCRHCNVKEMLSDKVETKTFSVEQLSSFLSKISKAYPSKNIEVLLIGGEPFLNEEFTSQVLHAIYPFTTNISITTNLSILPKNKELLKMIDAYQISIDGLEADHDFQRNQKGLFRKIYQNLGILKDMGLTDRIAIAACTFSHANKINKDYIIKFKTMLTMVGINWKDIMLGTANPATDQEDRNPSKMTEAAKENGPCCGWRYVQNLCISPDGSVWTHYYGVNNPNHLLGNLESSIDELKQAFIKSIMKSPFVNDSRCTNCKALIYCWGLFCFARWKFVDNPKPSNFCAYNEMQAKIAKWDCDLQINPIIRGVTI